MENQKELLKEARDWIKDCSFSDIEDDEQVDEMTDEQIWKGISKHYGGGIAQFMKDSNPESIASP
jgi:hypothetical protein